MLVELTVASHAMHKKNIFMNVHMTLPQVTIQRLVCLGITESLAIPLVAIAHQYSFHQSTYYLKVPIPSHEWKGPVCIIFDEVSWRNSVTKIALMEVP